ncbi:hypothetical protein K378_05132 [Streptomyces sp. Amel2xB2]|uniref:Uncharacterized protein n=1 Tax=Streptomyces nanshensis TaxID=518642 RepID=A0A1E7KQA6_9ACTN|nr:MULTISPECIES: hypothetical protein [Streptomyces]OEV06132.1 hypothetical protein AN218_31125 [Streptomyces nanshensis]RAJ58898.1 hypothetical protein K378_05132 [Streptomyces sp. Amel2xB2]
MVDPNKPQADARPDASDALYEDANQGVEDARQHVRDAASGTDTAELESALDELEAALAHREAARTRPTDDDWLLTALGAANAIDPEFHGDTGEGAGNGDDSGIDPGTATA